jgi:hypothetical protein
MLVIIPAVLESVVSLLSSPYLSEFSFGCLLSLSRVHGYTWWERTGRNESSHLVQTRSPATLIVFLLYDYDVYLTYN